MNLTESSFWLTNPLNNLDKEGILINLNETLLKCCKSSLVDWLIGIGTILLALAAFVTIISNYIKKYYSRPKINISIQVEPPDCHKTKFGNIIDTYYCRFKVENNGKTQANNVELMVSKLYKKKDDGKYKELKDITPLNLRWSYFNTPYVNISPNLFKHCDLIYIVKMIDIKAICPAYTPPKNCKVLFAFDFITKLNTFDFIREPGKYAIEVIASFSNCSENIKKFFRIEVKDIWYDNQDKMLKENIVIKPLNEILTDEEN